MIRLFANANYDFIGFRRVAYVLTAAIIIPGMIMIAVSGLNYSIEFTGGTLVEVNYKQAANVDRMRPVWDSPSNRSKPAAITVMRTSSPSVSSTTAGVAVTTSRVLKNHRSRSWFTVAGEILA